MTARKQHRLGGIIAFWLSAGALFGQANTGTISGSVKDPSGAAIPGTKIAVTNELTGETRTTMSSAAGYYTFALLPPGRCTITATAEGFKQTARTGVVLAAGQTLTVDLLLEIGTVSEAVTVSGTPPPIDFTTSAQHQTLGSTDIGQLPLAREDWSSMLSLGNGIAKGGVLNGITLNGLPAAAVNITLDGTNQQQDPELSTLGFYQGFNLINNVNTAAISEISITKGIAMPSNGATMSGNINIITRSGSNQFHGSLFEFNDNSALDARKQFLTNKPNSNVNTFGGSIGGYILKDKLFFFGSYEAIRSATFSALNANEPTKEFRASTLAVAPEYGTVFQYLPLPNQPYAPGAVIGAYVSSASAVRNDGNADARLDYYLNSTNQLTLRVTRSRPYQLNPSAIPINAQTYAGRNDVYNGQFTHTTGSWTTATRVAYNRLTLARLNNGYSADLNGISYAGFSSGGGAEDFQKRGGVYTAQEDVAAIRGKHTIEFGGIVQRNESGRFDDTTNAFQYANLSDFLADIPNSVTMYFPLTLFQLHMYQFGGYIQDAYRISPALTLNFGTRYDYWTVPKESDNRIFSRNPSPLGPGTGSLKPASRMYDSYWPNFSPRVGFAWGLGQARNTVVRGGFGVFFNSHNLYSGPVDDVQTYANVPFSLQLGRSAALAQGIRYPYDRFALQSQLIATGAPTYNTAIDNYFPNPYSLQYMLDVQQNLGHGFVFDTGFVMTRGLKLNLDSRTNYPDRVTGIALDPAVGTLHYYQAADTSSYYAWQTSLERRFANSLEFGVNYTWSRSFAYELGDLELHGYPQDINNVRADYGPTNYDQPNNFNAHVVYVLPLDRWAGVNGRSGRLLLGGWQVSSIFTAGSGFPATVSVGNSSYPADRPDAVSGVNPYFDNYQSTLLYLNSAAYALVPFSNASGAPIRPGNLSRNSVRTPGAWNVDLSAAKNFAIAERLNFQLRADFFNAFNHTNLSGLQTNINSSRFGQFTSAIARTIQVGARLTF